MQRLRSVRCLVGLTVLAHLAPAAFVCVAQDSTRKILKQVAAEYPSLLKRRGIGGVVKLRVVVGADGRVKDAQVVGGSPILAERAEKAVRQWIFSPAASESTIEVSVTFDPQQ